MAQRHKALVQGLLVLTILTPALALGAVHQVVLALYLIPAAALLVLLIVNESNGRPRIDLPGAIFLGLILFTLVQLIPLPASFVELISPGIYDVRSRSLRMLGQETFGFMPLTLDTTFTIAELGKLVLYIAVYWTCLSWTRRHGSRFILNLVVAVGVASATVFLAHRILLIDKVYGLYAPIHSGFGGERSSAPLINPNHMAGLLGLCSAVAIGHALSIQKRANRVLAVGIAALMGAALILTLSRGGIAAFIGGQCLFILVRVIQRIVSEDRGRASQHLVWLPLGLAFSLGLALFTAQDLIIGEFVGGNMKKLDLVFEGMPLIGRFWTTGVGRGAFWVGFPLVSEMAAKATFTHAENAVIQILADYGLLIGGAALIGMGIVVVRFLKEAPGRVQHSAALVALVAFGMHNLIDFNMEVPGVAVIAVALLAVLMGRQREKSNQSGLTVPRPVIIAIAVAALILSGVIGVFVAEHNVDLEERQYLSAFTKRNPKPFTDEELSEVLKRHPADWYIPFLVGVRHFHLNSANPLPWLSRAIELNPASAAAHLYVGRTLLRAEKLDQAMLELRLAARFNPRFSRHVAQFLTARYPRFETLAKIAVTKEDKLLLWTALAHAFALKGLSPEAETADIAILEVNRLEPRSLARHARRLADRGQVDEALDMARKLTALPEYGPSGARLQALFYEKSNMLDKAIGILEQELTHSPRHPDLLKALAWAEQRNGNYKGAIRAITTLRSLATNIESRSKVVIIEARLAVAEGRIQAALARYREASLLDPTNLDILRTTADLAERHNHRQRALEALKKLKIADPGDTAVKSRIKRIEQSSRH